MANTTVLTPTARTFLDKWLNDHEPFGPWGEEKFNKFLGALIATKKRRIDREELKTGLNKLIDRIDKERVIDEVLRRFDIVVDFRKATSDMIMFTFMRATVA